MTQLIISEKPAAAAKLASALGDFKQVSTGKTYYFDGEIKGKKTYIAPAVGHLFTLSSKEKKYPNFNLEWTPTWEKKGNAYAKQYAENIKKLAKLAKEFIVATDYDVEGEVIGYNCLRFLCNQNDAKRMKFSTLTSQELQDAYKDASQHIDFGQAEAGITRHNLDWMYGMNLSTAVSSSIRTAANRFITLSVGRVQGPALAILAKKEREIKKFKAKPYWLVLAHLNLKGATFTAVHKQGQVWNSVSAKRIFDTVRDKPATLSDIKHEERTFEAPVPFDLTTLQTESWRCFKITPKRTLQIAQNLYTSALISYPRTSSQKLPPSIGYRKILQKLANQAAYIDLANSVAGRSPRQGEKTDPAHPAIYPTGEMPKGLEHQEIAVYDLIVKRFLATFGDPSVRETTSCEFDIALELFSLSTTKTIKQGWMKLYWPYSKQKEEELPRIRAGEVFEQKTELQENKTKPSARYTPASIIKELERKDLGTKATRSDIIDKLYQREYIVDTSIQVTPLGLEVVDTFEHYAPAIVSEELTREFELEMDKIREGKQKKEKILEKAEKVITSICSDLDKHKKEVGGELASAFKETEKAANTLMKCPKCGKGEMVVRISKKSHKRFMACNAYPDCSNTWPLPQKGLLKITSANCKDCGTPMIVIINKGRRPWRLCIRPDCKGKN